MHVSVNGKAIILERPTTIADYLASRGMKYTLVSVAYNQEWTVRQDWPRIVLQDNDRLEIMRVVAGG